MPYANQVAGRADAVFEELDSPAFPAVHTDDRSRGCDDALLDRHPAWLVDLEADDPATRDLCLRHGYQVRSVLEPPDGPPLSTMWRSPMA